MKNEGVAAVQPEALLAGVGPVTCVATVVDALEHAETGKKIHPFVVVVVVVVIIFYSSADLQEK